MQAQVEGLEAVTARIAQIRSLVAPVGAVTAPPRAAGASASGQAFAATLAEVTARGPQGGVRTAYGSLGTSAPAPGAAAGAVAAFRAAHPNGKVPMEALSPIGRGGHRLAAPAAEAFTRMEAAAACDGIRFGVTDSYRSYEEQVDLVRRKGLYSQGGLAARPGTSQHGWGLAVDLDLDPAAQKWMRANGARFGFVEDTPREPWHWGYKG